MVRDVGPYFGVVVLPGGGAEVCTGAAENATYYVSAAGIAESRFAWSPWTPQMQNPAVSAGSAYSRSREEVLLMYLLMLFVFLILVLVRKRRTKLKIEIDL